MSVGMRAVQMAVSLAVVMVESMVARWAEVMADDLVAWLVV